MGVHQATASPLARRYALEEFYALDAPPEGGHYELIAGVLHVVPPPTLSHSINVSRLLVALATYAAAHPDQCILLVPRAAVWTTDTYLEPDMFLIRPERLPDMQANRPSSADLVVEVLSPSTAVYDRTAKADTYAALGVQELWLVDVQTQSIEQRVLRAAGWEVVGTFSGNEPVRARAFAGLGVIPSQIFA